MKVIAWNSDPPVFWETDENGQFTGELPKDYEGLCTLNGFLNSTGISPDGQRWFLNLESSFYELAVVTSQAKILTEEPVTIR